MTAGSLTRPQAAEQERPTRDPERDEGLFFELASWWGPVLLMLAPGAAVVYFGFNGGGFFPGAPAFVAMLLVQVLALRTLLADHPFAGFGRAIGIAVTGMSLYTAWVLASGLWSHSTSRALLEFDTAFVYLLALVVFGSLARTPHNLRWLIRGLVAGLFVVCAAGLITRVLPHLWPISPNVANNRLSFPVSYWNALGIMAAFGVVLCLHLASALREGRVVNVLSAAALPVFASTLLFTFSRGAIAAVAIGVIAYAAVAVPRGLPSGLLATVPFTAVAVVVGYGADKLASDDPTTPAAVSQGHTAAIVIAACCIAAGVVRYLLKPLDRRLARRSLLSSVPRRTLRLSAGGAVAVVLIVLLAAGTPGSVAHQWHKFVQGKPVTPTSDFRSRLTDPSNNGRSDHWRVAFKGFAQDRLKGTGSGTYVWSWDRHRPNVTRVLDGHGLYFETLSELGLVGLALLLVVVLTVLVTLVRRARASTSSASVYAAMFAVALMWALHAGVDWDWEMPAATFPFFAIAGAALARPVRAARVSPYVPGRRVPMALAVLAMAAAPVLILISESRLSTSEHAFAKGDCQTATRKALSSIDVLSVRPEPYEIIGYCDMQDGYTGQAVAAMQKAVSRDPGLWEYRAALAVARGAAGLDPRPDAARALAMDPRESFDQDVAKAFRGAPPSRWPAIAQDQRVALMQSGVLALP